MTGCLANHHRNRIRIFFFLSLLHKTPDRCRFVDTKLVVSIWGPDPMSSAGLCNVCHGGGVCHRYQDHGKQIKEMDFAAQATSSSHNQSCIFIGSATKAPAFRRPHSVVISLVTIFFFFLSPSRFSFSSRWFPRPDRRLVWSLYKRLQNNYQLLTLPCWFATHIPEC